VLKVTIICSDPLHPVRPRLQQWARAQAWRAEIKIIQEASESEGGDLMLLVSCQEVIRAPLRELYGYTLVLHASDLPYGKGMSPHVWQILEGKTDLTVTLLEASDDLDSGDIWHQELVHIPATALYDEVNSILFDAELRLMTWALDHLGSARPRQQAGKSTYYPRRKPEDSRISHDTTLGEAFNQLRIADPERYPAFFDYKGARFKITIERM
jgi:methionyl-tRNA formyltransferase